MTRAMNWIAAIVLLGMAHLALVNHLAAQTTRSAAASARGSRITRRSRAPSAGFPSFPSATWSTSTARAPTLPGSVIQRGNTNPVVKIRPRNLGNQAQSGRQ